jgi:selenide, water dikinase
MSICSSGGCGSKIGPGELSSVLAGLPALRDPRLLVGFDTADDAAVYQISDDLALVATADFFLPMVDEPRLFGRIAAANALSDVYAMGGTPFLALNLVCYPEHMAMDALGEILAGGAEKIQEAGAVVGGGHSIYDQAVKYGLAVTGQVHPKRIWHNDRPQKGDRLILTKPLGVGLVMAAHRGGLASDTALEAALASMQRLNKYAAEKAHLFPVAACTDITGFGLLVHAREMAGDGMSLVLHASEIPYIGESFGYAAEFLTLAAAQRNRNFFQHEEMLDRIPFAMQELLFDPQTSGGLLFSIPAECADEALSAIREAEPAASIIGEVVLRKTNPIILE